MLHGQMLHRQMCYGDMLHGQMLHGQMLHGQMLHGQMILGHLSTVREGSTNLKCPPQYFPWGAGVGGELKLLLSQLSIDGTGLSWNCGWALQLHFWPEVIFLWCVLCLVFFLSAIPFHSWKHQIQSALLFYQLMTTPPLKKLKIFDQTHWSYILGFTIGSSQGYDWLTTKTSDGPFQRKSWEYYSNIISLIS